MQFLVDLCPKSFLALHTLWPEFTPSPPPPVLWLFAGCGTADPMSALQIDGEIGVRWDLWTC